MKQGILFVQAWIISLSGNDGMRPAVEFRFNKGNDVALKARPL